MSPAIASYEITCGACPFQVEGQLSDGREFYFRYRSSLLRIGVGETHQGAVHDAMQGPVFADRSDVEGDYLGGVMSDAEFKAYMDEYLRSVS